MHCNMMASNRYSKYMSEIISSTHTLKMCHCLSASGASHIKKYLFHGYDINARVSTILAAGLSIYLRKIHALIRKSLASTSLRAF